MEDFIPTRGSEIMKNAAKEFTVVNYEAPKKKGKRKNESNEERGTLESNDGDKDVDQKKKQEKEMKRIRYEVMKFGMSGFEKTKAEEAKVQLAISLGAKPRKNRGINYKELKEERIRQRELEKIEEHKSGLENSMKKHKTAKTKKKKEGILGVYGKVGKKPESKKRR